MKILWFVILGLTLIPVGNYLIDGNIGISLVTASHAQQAQRIRPDQARCRDHDSERCSRSNQPYSELVLNLIPALNPNTNAFCTTVSGFSQTSQMLRGFFRLNTDVNVQGMVKGNTSVDIWGEDSTWLGANVNLHPVCDKLATDRLIMHISGEQQSLYQWEVKIEQAIDTVASVFPFLNELDLMAVTGGPYGTLCPAEPNRKSFGPWVRASENHPVINQAIINVIARKTVPGITLIAGSPLHVDSCSDYSDNKGHIGDDAVQDSIGAKFHNLYFN